MAKLFLFDIDGTLVQSSPHTAFIDSIKKLHGITIEDNHASYSGLTDKIILELMLEAQGWDSSKIKLHLPALLEEFERAHDGLFKKGSIRLLPGVKKLLVALQKRNASVGLITGNLESRAKKKLQDAGVWHYFKFGGYGSDPHDKRSDLVLIAVKKADFDIKDPNIYVVGDTPRDIEAAADAGVKNKIGVATGTSSIRELQAAGADVVFEDFADTSKVLRAFGLTE